MKIARAWGLAAVLSVAGYAATIQGASLPDAARNQDWETVRALAAQRAGINTAEADGTTALHWAAHWNNLEAVNELLQAGANPRAANRYGVTPLSEAARGGSEALVEALLKAGADPNTLVTTQGETVLMTAARTGNAGAVKALLAAGADVDARENYRGQTALMWAAAEGHPEVIRLLAAKGADLNVRSFDRDTKPPKLMAGTPSAPINRGGLTALLFAVRQGQIEAVKALLDAKTDVNQQDSDGNTGLILALLNNHYDLAQLLIDRGADVNMANTKDGRTALYTAVEVHDADWSPRPARRETDKLTSLDLIRSLLDKGAKPNAALTAPAPIVKLAQDTGDRTLAAGATPFMRAARSADVDVMKMLLAKGADPKMANKDGLNALMLAAGNGWADKIKGTEAEALEAVKLCVAQGLDVNAATDKGDTALHGAANRGADSIVKYLVEKGAKVNAANKRGLTPLDIANGKGGAPGSAPTVREKTAALLAQLGGTAGKEITKTAEAK